MMDAYAHFFREKIDYIQYYTVLLVFFRKRMSEGLLVRLTKGRSYSWLEIGFTVVKNPVSTQHNTTQTYKEQTQYAGVK